MAIVSVPIFPEISASPLDDYCKYKKEIDVSFVCPNGTDLKENQLDVIWYGVETGNYGINFLSHFEDLGLSFEQRTKGPIDNLNAKAVFVFFTPSRGHGELGFTESEVKELVNFVKGGGQLVIGADTQYAYCLQDTKCAFDFTLDHFGFKFGGDVQTGLLLPSEGNQNHPIWKSVHDLDSFRDWGFDAYIAKITDEKNIKVLSTVSAQSFNNFTGFTYVQNVPAIIVNENPSFNGGRVLAGGYNMIVGLGNISLLDNILSFVLDIPIEKIEPAKKTEIDPAPITPLDPPRMSPKKQIRMGVDLMKIYCNYSLVLIQKYDGSPACVEQESVPKLNERGWISIEAQTTRHPVSLPNPPDPMSITIQDKDFPVIPINRGETKEIIILLEPKIPITISTIGIDSYFGSAGNCENIDINTYCPGRGIILNLSETHVTSHKEITLTITIPENTPVGTYAYSIETKTTFETPSFEQPRTVGNSERFDLIVK